MQHAIALDKYLAWPVDQNFRHRGVAQQHFQRTEAGQFVDQFFSQALHFVTRNGQPQPCDVFGHLVDDELRQGRS